MHNKEWMKKKYDSVRLWKPCPYILVSMKLKRLRIINFLEGRQTGDEIITLLIETVKDFLQADEYIAQISSTSFELLMKVSQSDTDNDLVRRFNDLDERLDKLGNEKYKGVVFCGFGICYLSDYDVDYETAEYYAEISRSQSPENPFLISHLNIYGRDFIDKNLTFLSLKKNFNAAMANEDIKIYLQPKVNLKTGMVESAEALIRWLDDERGMIPLTDFLPSLEENGLTMLIDKLAFKSACIYTKKWLEEYGKKMKISVNISKNTFEYWIFFDEYKEIYDEYPAPKDCLEVEFLESIVLNQVDRVCELVKEIQDFGFTCSLDDFGSGFSSYSVLTIANLDNLKLDRSLFLNFDNTKEKSVIKHIIEIAHELGMRVIAEGIEDMNYVNFLRELHCDYIQGFVFYKPMPIEEFEQRFIIGNEKIVFD